MTDDDLLEISKRLGDMFADRKTVLSAPMCPAPRRKDTPSATARRL